MLVLDTDHLTILENTSSSEGQRLRQRLALIPPDQRSTTVVSYEEQTRGRLASIAAARTSARMIEGFLQLRRLLKVYCGLTLLDFDAAAADHFEHFRQAKIRGGTKDLQIAAIVLAHDATLLSRNLRDFRRVPSLKVEDWTITPGP